MKRGMWLRWEKPVSLHTTEWGDFGWGQSFIVVRVCWCGLLWIFETRLHPVMQAGLELETILLPQASKCLQMWATTGCRSLPRRKIQWLSLPLGVPSAIQPKQIFNNVTTLQDACSLMNTEAFHSFLYNYLVYVLGNLSRELQASCHWSTPPHNRPPQVGISIA